MTTLKQLYLKARAFDDGAVWKYARAEPELHFRL